jgi:quaternary ammonium compound-resistance protein SugE
MPGVRHALAACLFVHHPAAKKLSRVGVPPIALRTAKNISILPSMGWLYLLLSIAFEIGWASSLKSTAGYSRLWPSVINTLLTIGGTIALAKATKSIPIAIAYPVWIGVSLIGVVLLSVYAFGETLGVWHYFFIALIVAGVIGLNVITNT